MAAKLTQPKPPAVVSRTPWATATNTQAAQANEAKMAAERREAAYREQQAAQRAAAAPKPVAPGAVVPTGPPAPPITAPPVEDDQYALDIGNLIGEVTKGRAQVKAAGEQDRSDFERLIAQLVQQRDERLTDTTLGSNREGLLYSTTLSKRRGAVEKDHADREGEQREFLRRREAEREAQLADIGEIIADASTPGGYRATGGAGSRLGQFLLDAISRRDQRNRDLAPPPVEDTPVDQGAPAAPGPAYAAVLAPRGAPSVDAKYQAQMKAAADARARAQAQQAKAKSRSRQRSKR